MVSFNPSCHIPSAVNQYLPSAIACAPPPSYFATAYEALTSPLSSTYTTLRTAMDALVSLPILSLFLIPTMTSYSTSLNILFFYLTWSTLVLSHPPLRVEIVATLAIRILFYIFPSTLFLLFDILLPSAAESLKATRSAALPFRDASRRRAFRTLRKLCWSIGNVLLSVLAQASIEILLTRVLVFRSALKVTTSLPMPWSIVKDLLRGFLAREVIAYTLHRYLLHESSTVLSVYHETWYHTISSPFPLSASYDHPASYLIRFFLPTFLPAFLFRFHLLTYMLYLALISLEETFSYSGYSTVPTNFILGGIARRTDNHVLCAGEGNFGPWGLVDWIMGTSIGTRLVDDVVAEADSHDLQGKVERGGRRAEQRLIREKSRLKRVTKKGGAGAGSAGGSRAANSAAPRRRRRRSSDDSE